MYVDDALDSCETVPEAKDLQKQTTELLSEAGFPLRKWMSNEVEVIEDIPFQDRLPGLEIQNSNLPTVKTLGVSWQANRDVFTFQVTPPPLSELSTKRNVLSSIAKLFDPMQILSPFTIRAKILLQKIWATGIEWDEQLPAKLNDEWKEWTKELNDLIQFEIPRSLRLPNPTKSWLHTFSDASKDAYAAASYLVCEYDGNPPTARLIASKTRVAPLNAVTIPRLELMGAVLATRLSTNILRTINMNGVTYWTDSTNVLYWIRNQSRIFKPFVANRVAEIQRESNPDQWRHVPGEFNPADLPTRGVSATELCQSKSWMCGPQFLTNEEEHWPERLLHNPSPDAVVRQEKKVKTHGTHETEDVVDQTNRLDPRQYSSWTRLVGVTAWIKRFVKNCKAPSEFRNKSCILQSTELSDAQTFWLRKAKVESFPSGEKDKRLLRFSPLLDKDGLLRLDGWLRLAKDLSYDRRHPVILPRNHPVMRLVIVDTHEKLGHAQERNICWQNFFRNFGLWKDDWWLERSKTALNADEDFLRSLWVKRWPPFLHREPLKELVRISPARSLQNKDEENPGWNDIFVYSRVWLPVQYT